MLKTDKEVKKLYFVAKVTVFTDTGDNVIPFTDEELAYQEQRAYEDGDVAYAVEVSEWDDADQAWWNEKKVLLVASFGDDYLDDNACLGMLKMFSPCYNKDK